MKGASKRSTGADMKTLIEILRRPEATETDLGDFAAGEQRWAHLGVPSGAREMDFDAPVGVSRVPITVRLCDQTQTWMTGDRLRVVEGLGIQGQIFEIVAPGSIRPGGAFITFQAEAGLVHETD